MAQHAVARLPQCFAGMIFVCRLLPAMGKFDAQILLRHGAALAPAIFGQRRRFSVSGRI